MACATHLKALSEWLQGKTLCFFPLKKQQLPMKKPLFPLETRFFSFSIRNAGEEAHSHW